MHQHKGAAQLCWVDHVRLASNWGTILKKTLFVLPFTALLLAGCGGSPQSTPTAPTVEPATSNQTASASPTTSADGGAKSSRGNLVKKVGEGASVTDKDKTVASFVVNSIEVDPQCTGTSAAPAENGHFVALDVSMETAPELAESVNPQFGLAGYGWKAIADNGTTFNGSLSSFSAFMCFPDAERFPSALGPGEKATGKIVLDVPTPTGVLVHQQGFMPAGWEWEYPAK